MRLLLDWQLFDPEACCVSAAALISPRHANLAQSRGRSDTPLSTQGCGVKRAEEASLH